MLNFPVNLEIIQLQPKSSEFRLQYLEKAIDKHMDKLTPMLCMKTINHAQKHFGSCMRMEELDMGDIPRD